MDLGAMAKHRCNSGDMSMQNAYDDTHDDEADLTALLPQNLTTSMSLLEAMNGNHPMEAASSGPSMTATHHSPCHVGGRHALPPLMLAIIVCAGGCNNTCHRCSIVFTRCVALLILSRVASSLPLLWRCRRGWDE